METKKIGYKSKKKRRKLNNIVLKLYQKQTTHEKVNKLRYSKFSSRFWGERKNLTGSINKSLFFLYFPFVCGRHTYRMLSLRSICNVQQIRTIRALKIQTLPSHVEVICNINAVNRIAGCYMNLHVVMPTQCHFYGILRNAAHSNFPTSVRMRCDIFAKKE